MIAAALVAAAVAVLAPAGAASAAACTGGCLVVTVTGDGPDETTTLSLDEITGMLETGWAGTYQWRPREDEPPTLVGRQEIGGRLPLSALLARVGVPAGGVKYVVVDGGGTRRSELERDLGDLDPRGDGLEPAFFTSGVGGSAGIGFVRTLRIPDEVDPFDGYWLGPGGEPVRVTVSTKGRLLHPTITACAPFVAGQPCALEAVLDPPVPGATYSWRYEGAYSSPVAGPQATSHVYADGGPYEVLVEVSAPDGSIGLGRKVIGKPTRSETGGQQGGGHGTKPTSPNTGPKHGTGSKPVSTPSPGPDGGAPGATSGSPPAPAAPTEAEPEQSAPSVDARPQVSGVVLAGPGIRTTYVSQERGTPSPAASRRYAPHRSWTLPVGVLVVLALLGAGAGSESRFVTARLGRLAGRWRRGM